MPISWLDARTSVRGDLWRPGSTGVPDDQCDRALHAALLELEAQRRWLWLEAIRRTVALTVAANQVSVPADLVSIESVVVVQADGSMDAPLALKTLPAIRIAASQAPDIGYPTAYALGASGIYLDSKAQPGCLIEFIGKVRTPPAIADAIANAATNITLQLQQGAIIKAACAEIARSYLKNEAEEARQQRSADRYLERLMDEEDEKRADLTGGLVQPDTLYADMAHGC